MTDPIINAPNEENYEDDWIDELALLDILDED